MKERSRAGEGQADVWKWFGVIVFVVAALVAAGYMLQAMGLVDLSDTFLRALEATPALQEHVAVYRLGLEASRALERDRRDMIALRAEILREREAIEAERALLAEERASLDAYRAELEQRARQLDVRQSTLDAQAARIADLRRLQEVYNEMRPKEVAAILAEMDDDFVVRLLDGMDEDQVARTLAEMDPARAARLSWILVGPSSK